MYYRRIGLALGLIALGGCGGSGVSREASFASLGASFENGIDRLIAADDPTQFSDLPRSGALEFRGSTAYVEAPSDANPDDFELTYLALGDLVVTADFANQEIRGDAQNFYEVVAERGGLEFTGADNAAIEGRLVFQVNLESEVFPNAAAGNVNGTISKLNGDRAAVDLEIFGFFFDGLDGLLLTNGDEVNEDGQSVLAFGTRN